MFLVNLSSLQIDDFFGIAVIGGDNHCSAPCQRVVHNLAQTFINRFRTFPGGFKISRMPYHVGIGIIDRQKIEFFIINGPDGSFGNFLSRHLRRGFKTRHFQRRHQQAFFSGKRLINRAIKKIGNMGIFGRFGQVELF